MGIPPRALLLWLVGVAASVSMDLGAEEARLEAEIARLHKRESEILQQMGAQSASQLGGSADDGSFESVVLLDTGAVEQLVASSGSGSGLGDAEAANKEAIQAEIAKTAEEVEEKKFINNWPHAHPTKRQLGVVNADEAWAAISEKKAKAATATQSYNTIANISNALKADNAPKIQALQAISNAAEANVSRPLLDAFADVESWHEVAKCDQGKSSGCQSVGCVTLEGKGVIQGNVEDCQKTCDADPNCNTINFCPTDRLGFAAWDGDVRLSEFPKGRVEIYKGGQWGTLCGRDWNTNAHGASNICKQVGYAEGEAYDAGVCAGMPYQVENSTAMVDENACTALCDGDVTATCKCSMFVEGSSSIAANICKLYNKTYANLPIVAGFRTCNGTEANIFDCQPADDVDDKIQEQCTHKDDQGVKCLGNRDMATHGYTPRNTCSTTSQRRCCKLSCQKCTGDECQFTTDNKGWDVRTVLPGDDVARYYKAKYMANEAKVKYEIAMLKTQEAESRHDLSVARSPKTTADFRLAKKATQYEINSNKAARAIGSANEAALKAINTKRAEKRVEMEHEEGLLKADKDEYKRLDTKLHTEHTSECQVMDLMHRSLLKQVGLRHGFDEAEARCAALKALEHKACAGKPISTWNTTQESLRRQEAKIEVQETATAEAIGYWEAFDNASKHAETKELRGVLISSRMGLKETAAVNTLKEAKLMLDNDKHSMLIAEQEVEMATSNESLSKAIFQNASANETALDSAHVAAVNELAAKKSEILDKTEIKSKLDEAEKEHKDRVESLTLVFREAEENATSYRATSLNLADLAQDARTSYTLDNTTAKKLDMEAAETDYEHAHNQSVAAKAEEETAKNNLDTKLAQDPGAAILDNATEFDVTSANARDISQQYGELDIFEAMEHFA